MKKENGACLSVVSRQTFFSLFLPLLNYVNLAYELSDTMHERMRLGMPPFKTDLKNAADALWEDPSIIDEYIEARDEMGALDPEDRSILMGWKHPVSGLFVLERHLSRGSIFIDPETEKVYQVKGLSDPWEKMLGDFSPPFPIRATLLPFRDCIISDGLVSPEHVSFGPGYQEQFKQLYLTAKESGRILTSLEKG